ncbi:MAG: hypothetical protein ABSC45_09585 [Desulfobaccales bacterium]|jgi:hypothetical protein
MKSKLTVLIIGIGLILWPNIGRAQAMTLDGTPVIGGDTIVVPSPEQEMRDRQRFQWEKEDRQNRKAMQEEMETKAEDDRRAAAISQARAASRAKVERLRKEAGEEPFHSAQVEHQY